LPRDDRRERLIDAALKLCARQGYDATTLDQIAANAGMSVADSAKYFPTTEAVIMAIAEDMARETAAALKRIEKGIAPERALLSAGVAAVTAVVEGRSELTLDRLLAMTRVVSATRNLLRSVSAARKRVITQALADWMGVDPKDRRLQRALTMWSAVTASAYVAASEMPEDHEPQRDGGLQQQMIASLSQSYGDVMGVDPYSPG
jgi:AcrR family transcriptional regulator